MALEAVRALVPYNPGWCEEPITAHNNESMAQVVAASPLRITTCEHIYARDGFLDLLQRKAAHVVQPDITYSGGFLETKNLRRWWKPFTSTWHPTIVTAPSRP